MLKILLSLKKFLRYSFKSLLKFAFQIKNLIQSNSFHIYTPYIQEKFKNSSLHACQTDHEFSIRNFHRNFHPYSLLLSLPRNFSRNFIQRKQHLSLLEIFDGVVSFVIVYPSARGYREFEIRFPLWQTATNWSLVISGTNQNNRWPGRMRSGRRIIYQPSIPNEIYDGINIEKVQVFV